MRVRHPRRGFTLVEIVISTAIVGVMLVAGLRAVASARLGYTRMSDQSRGAMLAEDLMGEILRQAYYDPDGTPVFGREATETGTTRASFDDVDDYNGWTASPPQFKDGTVMTGFSGWDESVTVQAITAADVGLSAMTLANADTGLKRIVVTIKHDGAIVAQLTALRSIGWTVSVQGQQVNWP